MSSDRGDSFLARATGLAVRHPVLTMALVVVVQVVPALHSRDYWAFDEVRHANALENLLEGGHWFSLRLNGQPYPDKPPVYFWLVAGAAKLLGTDGPASFFLVSGLGAFLFLLATWALARATLAKDRPALALLAALLVTASPLYQLLLRTTRMDLVFGALILASEIALYRGIREDRRSSAVVLGFALAGLAALVKGPVGIAFPLAATILFLLWTARPRRLLAWDVGLGLGVALLMIAGWMIGIGLTEGWGYLRSLISGQVIARTLESHKHSQPFFFFLLVLPIAWLPWSALLVTVHWREIFRRANWQRVFRKRREDPQGGAWIAWTFLAGLLLLSLATSKLFIYLMPLLGPLAVATSVWLRRLGGHDATRTFTLIGGGALLAGLGLPWLEALLPWEGLRLASLIPTAVALTLTGALVLAFRRHPVRFPLTATLAGLYAVNLLLGLGVAPSLDPIMSPREQARVIAVYAEEGYAPLVFKTYPGTYTYYAGRNLPESKDPAMLRRHVEEQPRALVTMARKYWERHAELLEEFTLVHEQFIEGRPFIVAVRPPPEAAR